MTKVIIRNILESEVSEAIACIHSASIRNKKDYPSEFIDYLNTSGYTVDWLKRSIETREFFVAVLNGKIVGTGSHIENNIVNIFVNYEFQGKGIGNKLMDHLEEILLKKGYSELKLNANLSSVAFYEHRGFSIVQEVNEEILDWKIKSFKMRKKIDSELSKNSLK